MVRAVYVLVCMFLLYMPLVLILVSNILHGVTIRKGPSKRRGVMGLIFAWLASYQGLLLVVMFIMFGMLIHSKYDSEKAVPYRTTTMMTFDTNSTYSFGYAGKIRYGDYPLYIRFGWSAYVGVVAVVCGLASAIVSSVSSWKGEKAPDADTIPLQSDYE